MERVILHSDLNNFYASVECLYDPSLRDKPVAVGGNPESRHGIVLAKNQLAKERGVKTAEAIWQARQKCKDIIFVPPNYERYQRFSKMARDIYESYTPLVQSFGLDECWLDVSGSLKLFGDGQHIANEIRERIKFEMGITASVGVSFNKIFAKLGSDMKKPDATTVITKENFKERVWPLPANDLLYVGPATFSKLERCCIHTIGELANTDPHILQSILGRNGVMLWHFANGNDFSVVSSSGSQPFKAASVVKSIGNSTTTPHDLVTPNDVKITLYVLAESVAMRLREQSLKCKTVQISIRDVNLNMCERQTVLPFPLCTSTEIAEKAYELYLKNNFSGIPMRSLGVRVCNLIKAEDQQLSLYPEIIKTEKHEMIEETIDKLRNRFGHFSIQRGIMYTDRKLSHINPKEDHTIFPVGIY